MTGPLTANATFSPLFADPEVSLLFSADVQIGHWIEFEAALTRALSAHGLVDARVAAKALIKIETFDPDIKALGEASLVDGLPAPAFVRQLKEHVGPDLVSAVHVGATSQDLIDTGIVLALRELSEILRKRIAKAEAQLDALSDKFGECRMMGRTRMQAALPISIVDRILTWRRPLSYLSDSLKQVRVDVEQMQFGGAVGTRHALGDKGAAIAEHLANHFSLSNPRKAWHATRLPITGYGNWLSETTGALGKMGMDICLMAQQGVDEVKLSGAGTSSAMPHKQNPVLAEMLVTFSRFNATQIAALHQSLVHEQERSGMAWTLEWMILPQMAEVTGKALLHAEQLLGQIERLGEA